MKKIPEFENILDDCLERLVKGETLEQCLKRYPQQASQLEPLLRTAEATQEATAIEPRPEFRARARYEFQAALSDMTRKQKRPGFALRRGWVLALLVIGIVLVSGGGTSLAANNSMPDSLLYPVKLASEQIQLALTPSAVDKAQLCAELADRRVTEIIYMAARGDAEQVQFTTQRLDERLTVLASLVSTGEGAMEVASDSAPQMMTTEETAMAPPAPAGSAPAPATTPTSPEAALTLPEEGAIPAPGAEEDAAATTKDLAQENGGRSELRSLVEKYAASHQEALFEVLEAATPSVEAALEQAIDVSQAGYRRALAALD